ncbi:integrator complex subunit 11-like [Pollicipes pollicipes]|uniref:integrator complex subunit 11-like n=1 Tax=Pollicipes pollicipes TaxID=41117 RepID=UPI0018854CE7|nr:integrator complex subunit 11-like [Pollicipes pollicipes]
MPEIKVTPLGAGQDVGRSCILVTIGGKNIMLDCGMHMGYNDERRFPDFSYIADGSLTEHLDCVIVSHFHLDHCGALPYMTEMVGYAGPIYMTYPTKAIAPILLEDMRKVAVERKGETNFFTSQMIKDCMKKVVAVNLHQTVQVDSEIEIKAYYAGHVLGAAMFHVRVGDQSVVYTGDYNMTPDRHLGAAWIDRCCPDLLITESTYATTIRDSKRCRERDILKKVHECVERGGKVLIPVFALGRAQELCILLESYWERTNLKVPVYFSLGLTEKANNYYKMFITWTNQKIKKTFVERNMFEFSHIKPFDKSYMDNPGPMVVFASPGMLHAGLSLNIFKRWAPDEKNMLIMPGYCVAGTVGHKVLNGAKKVEFDNRQTVEVKMAVEYMSFSAHADAKGIMQLITYCQPKNVLLVHGDAEKMVFLKSKIEQELSLACYKPANGETCTIVTQPTIAADVSLPLLKRDLQPTAELGDLTVKRRRLLHGVLVVKGSKVRVLESEAACTELGITRHEVRFTSTVTLQDPGAVSKTIDKLHTHLQRRLGITQHLGDGPISIGSVLLQVSGSDQEDLKDVIVSWTYQDEALGSYILSSIKNIDR